MLNCTILRKYVSDQIQISMFSVEDSSHVFNQVYCRNMLRYQNLFIYHLHDNWTVKLSTTLTGYLTYPRQKRYWRPRSCLHSLPDSSSTDASTTTLGCCFLFHDDPSCYRL